MTLLKANFWIFRSSPISWVFSYLTTFLLLKISNYTKNSLCQICRTLCLILAHHFAFTVHIKRKLFRAAMADMVVLLLFSPIHGNYIWYTDCCKVSMSYVMQTLDVAVEIFSQNPNRNLWQNQKKSCHRAFPFADHIASNNIADEKQQKFCVFLLNENILNNYHWAHKQQWKGIGYKWIQGKGFRCLFQILSESFQILHVLDLPSSSVTGPCWCTFAPGQIKMNYNNVFETLYETNKQTRSLSPDCHIQTSESQRCTCDRGALS